MEQWEQFRDMLVKHAERCATSQSEQAEMLDIGTAAWMSADDEEKLRILRQLREFNSMPSEAEMRKRWQKMAKFIADQGYELEEHGGQPWVRDPQSDEWFIAETRNGGHFVLAREDDSCIDPATVPASQGRARKGNRN